MMIFRKASLEGIGGKLKLAPPCQSNGGLR
jgi:hypothetical protein